ncbi:caspase family protein [Trinickia dinghuensis]|uniref:Caspase family protein n=1 Tax=Trinickia dinghuensis TaxID=2291023 RepID=A0A3D8JQ80_9BURK|nr:caspase family protein [Trinickia dinghuensis]RDU95178.1 caspase family protein [Trinickia dinghuensis]
MTKNLAVLVGVTDYVEEKLKLPACVNDVSIMQELLRGAGKFDDVINIPSDDAQTMKARIADTIGRFQQEDIGELFFYFTGHGEFVDEDFRFMFRDYSRERPAQTTLENSELDRLLRSLSPALTVKVVDACYSGIPYVKDGASQIEAMMAETQSVFAKCYFYFSSQSDQRSWATETISDFTRAFVQTIACSTLESIRYKDVMDGVSDAFLSTPRQKPLFVMQGDYTEVFGNFAEEVRQRLGKRLVNFEATQIEQPPTAIVMKSSLAEVARSQAVDYVTVETAIAALNDLKSELDRTVLNSELGQLFTMEKEYFDKFDAVPSQEALGEWLAKNDEDFFAVPVLTTETYEVDHPMNNILGLIGQDAKKTTRTRKVISGVRTKVSKLPFQAFRITLVPSLPNLTQYCGWLTFLVSKRTLQTFYRFIEYSEETWGAYRYSKGTEWTSADFSLARFDGGAGVVDAFMPELQSYVEAAVAARLGVDAVGDGSTEEHQ